MAATAAGQTAAASGSLTPVGVAPGCNFSSVTALSADGTVAGGFSYSSTIQPAFVWSSGAGRYDFGLDPGMPAVFQVLRISGNGPTTHGVCLTSTSVNLAFPWNGPGPVQPPGIP